MGYGLFPLADWLAVGGRFGIGTDSHVGIAARDELRLLETGQRLLRQSRSIATTEASPHPGQLLLDGAMAGGAQALGRPVGAIAPGRRCELVELETDHPSLAGHSGDTLLDAWGFSGQHNPIRTVIVGGRRVVEAGLAREIGEEFAMTIRRLPV